MKNQKQLLPPLALLVIFFVTAMLILSGCTKKQKLVSEFLTYENPTYGIRMKYPSSWTKKEQVKGLTVAFISPKEGLFDLKAENVGIAVGELSTPTTLDERVESALKWLKQDYSNFQIIESGKTTINNNSAHKLVFTGNIGGYAVKSQQVWMIKNNKVYFIMYTAGKDQYSKFLEAVEAMINSFEII